MSRRVSSGESRSARHTSTPSSEPAGEVGGQPRRPGADDIYRELRDRIALLTYEPGAMLGETALAEEFGVSRTPIRQALQHLESEGLVVTRRGVGTMVTTLDLPYLRAVYTLRLKLIDVIGDLSPGRVAGADLGPLEAILAAAEAMGSSAERTDMRELARLYVDFNRELSRAIGNRPLREIADRLFYQTSRVWLQLAPDLDHAAEVEYVVDEMRRVHAALERGDMREVAAVRREHMIGLLRRINDFIGAELPARDPAAGSVADGDSEARDDHQDQVTVPVAGRTK